MQSREDEANFIKEKMVSENLKHTQGLKSLTWSQNELKGKRKLEAKRVIS